MNLQFLDTVRSADWVAASYATQNSPSTYLTLNCEENSTTKNCDDPERTTKWCMWF